MKRSKLLAVSTVAIVIVLLAMGGFVDAAAQKSSPRFGTWKLKGSGSNVERAQVSNTNR